MNTRFVLAALLTLAAAGLAVADGAARKRDLKERIELEGTIVCIGCTLEQQDGGADAQCTLFAKHAQGLQLADGTVWTFVDNARGHGLITNEKLRGKAIKLLAWKFPKAQYLEAWRYSLKQGDAWEQYDFCKACGWEAGDNQDTDTCEDCRE